MRVELYRDKRGRWRWRAKAANGRIVAASNQSFSTKRNALVGARAAANVFGDWARNGFVLREED